MTDKTPKQTAAEAEAKPLIDIKTGNKTVDGSIQNVSRFVKAAPERTRICAVR